MLHFAMEQDYKSLLQMSHIKDSDFSLVSLIYTKLILNQ